MTRAVVLALGLSFVAAATAAAPISGRITEENFEARHVGGPDSDAGIGDWFLSNGTLCAAIADVDHEAGPSPHGGTLIDLGLCGANHDQWAVLQPLLNLSQDESVPVAEMQSGTTDGSAWVRTLSVFAGVEFVTTYLVDEAHPTSVLVETRGRRVAEGDALFSVGSILLHPSGQTPVFSLTRAAPDRSLGFAYPSSDRRSMSSLAQAIVASDLHVLVGGDHQPPISYGVERLPASLDTTPAETPGNPQASTRLTGFSISGSHFTFLNTLTNPTWLGSPSDAPGLLQMMQVPFMDIPSDAEFVQAFRIHVGARADVASITDQIWPGAARVTGAIDDPDARIHIDLESGAPFSQVRPSPTGSFELRLPPGRYRARALAPAERETQVAFEVAPDATHVPLPAIVLGAAGSVEFTSPGFIGRLRFLREDGSGAAVFGSNQLGFAFGEKSIPSGTEAPWLNLAGSPVDPKRVALAPGRYRVVAVRGPEYAAHSEMIEVRSGATTPLALPTLPRTSPTEGWIAADLHVHTARSFDSNLPQEKQIVAFAASGAEVLVATEHNRIHDPRPAIDRTRLNDRLVSITGIEVTSSFAGGDSPHGTGHLNVFPSTPVPKAYRRGAPRIEGRRLRDVLSEIESTEPLALIQMNHPRPKPNEGEGDTFFAHLGVAGEPFAPTRPLTDSPNSVLIEASPSHGGRDLDYHAVELMNASNLVRYRRTRADWLSMLLQGEFKVGTANSDSHRLGVIVGLPRTYVAVGSDRVEDFDETGFISALRAGHAYGTTGPLLRVRLDQTGIGGLHRGASGTLEVQVDAADWIPIREWRAYVNGELVHRAEIARGERAALPLAFARDGFVTVEVEGPAEGLYRDALPDFTPLAWTNPIFVDVDGNGRYDAPGLPEALPQTLVSPDLPD